MVRHEFSQGSIRIAFGLDHITGYFISVYDERLAINKAEGGDFDEIRKGISLSGDGAYLNAHTGPVGFGKQVTRGEEGMRLLRDLECEI
ncbi:MAG: hypothetical protein M1826_000118 [Phylliscum demangeonii]|nr:MAG: hypothetical protein M1826_000118 [Phylliscum demangeonii]